jgi:NlpC/P60 family putative phage cell wall peptidase
MTPAVGRHDVVAIARGWIGTPYRHQASVAGVGTDCLGLVRGIWRTIYGSEPQSIPPYSRDWAEASGEEAMLAAARRCLVEVAAADMRPGDVLAFRWRRGAVAKHAGVLASPGSMIHAAEGVAVAEVPLSPWWRRRLVATFQFPGIVD